MRIHRRHGDSQPAPWLHLLVILATASWSALCAAQGVDRAADAPADPSLNLGPYNVTALEGGIGIIRPLAAGSILTAAGAPWSMSGWARRNSSPESSPLGITFGG